MKEGPGRLKRTARAVRCMTRQGGALHDPAGGGCQMTMPVMTVSKTILSLTRP